MWEILLTSKKIDPPGDGLLSMLTDNNGLAVNGNGEVYAPNNQQTTPGDGKRYDFKPDPEGRLITKLTATFRYTANNAALTAAYFYWLPGTTWETRVGLYDEWNAQAGFRLVSDIHDRVLTTSSFNGTLTRTFNPPIAQSELSVKFGGRMGLSYSPAYISNVEIEYA
ncbi:hypothetical protein [Pseudomonas phage D6]|nr:hypothetical protein [Pseudomonas phage D6]